MILCQVFYLETDFNFLEKIPPWAPFDFCDWSEKIFELVPQPKTGAGQVFEAPSHFPENNNVDVKKWRIETLKQKTMPRVWAHFYACLGRESNPGSWISSSFLPNINRTLRSLQIGISTKCLFNKSYNLLLIL